MAKLTVREMQIADLFMDGLTDTEIARRLQISTSRVAQIKHMVLRKLYRDYQVKFLAERYGTNSPAPRLGE